MGRFTVESGLGRRIFRLALLTIMATGLSACLGPSPNLIRPSAGGPVPERDAVVVVKVGGKGPGMFGIGETDRSLMVALREEAKPGHLYLFPKHDEFEVFHVRPGRYMFYALNAGELPVVREPLPALPYDPASDVPVTPFTLEAGDIVYLGSLLISGVRHVQMIVGPSEALTFSVTDDTAAAREALRAEYPHLADKMETRLFAIDAPDKGASDFLN